MGQLSSGNNHHRLSYNNGTWTTVGVAAAIVTATAIAVAFRNKKSSSSRSSSSSSSDGRMVSTSSNSNDNNGNNNSWHDRLHPELVAPPGISLDSTWKVYAIRALACLVPSGRPAPGVGMIRVGGIGTYFYPENDDERRRRRRRRDDGTTTTTTIDDDGGGPRCAIMWIHGGGRVIGRSCLPGDVAICCRIVLLFGAPVLSADYRKPPGHPFPAGLDDLREAYRWLSGRVRGGRIGISGMSAGGGLAAELCQRLLDESRGRNDAVGGGGEGGGEGGGGEERQPAPLPLPACQLLLDPMLDDRTSCGAEKKSESSASFSSSSDDDAPPHILWNHKSNAFAWSLYLGPMYEPGMDGLPEYSSASRRRDLSGLPPAFVHVGDLDLFHDECSAYARRLVEHGVPTELVVTEGGYHGYMLIHIDSGPANEIWERLRAFGGRYLLDENGKSAGVNYKELAYIRE